LDEGGQLKGLSTLYGNEDAALSAVTSAPAGSVKCKALKKVISALNPVEGEWVLIPGSEGHQYYCWKRHHPYRILKANSLVSIYPSLNLAAAALGTTRGKIGHYFIRENTLRLEVSLLGDVTVKKVECSSERVECLPDSVFTVPHWG
jgi:hypothetical protein